MWVGGQRWALVKGLCTLAAVFLLTGCGWFGDEGPKNLAEAKKSVEKQTDAWCTCFREAQEDTANKAEETTNCMDMLPGAKFEVRVAASANLSGEETRELRSHTIAYRRKVEAKCR